MTVATLSLQIGPPGVSPTESMTISPGIRVLTGRNNVGKSRILRTWNNIAAGSLSEGPFTVEVQYNERQYQVRGTVGPSSLHYKFWDQAGTLLGDWKADVQGGQYLLRNLKGGQTISQVGSLSRLAVLNQAPEFSTLLNALKRIVYVPPQRSVNPTVPAQGLVKPPANGDNIGQVLYQYRSHEDPRMEEFDRVMADMFPEIERVLTPAETNSTNITIMIKDRFANKILPVQQCGSGVAQMIHLVALVIFSEPDRIFLIDEPHVFLHPESERALGNFLRRHPEHSYVVATHSTTVINALNPDTIWLVSRDHKGSHVKSVFMENHPDRLALFQALGWKLSDFAWYSRILFVEGPSDDTVWQIFFERWGWTEAMQHCAVVPLGGAGSTEPVQDVLQRVQQYFDIPIHVCLDGDQRDKVAHDPSVVFLPCSEMENILIRDASAVRRVLLEDNPLVTESRDNILNQWPVDRIQQELNRHQDSKGSKRLIDLAHDMGVRYNKITHNPQIATYIALNLTTDLQILVESFVRADSALTKA